MGVKSPGEANVLGGRNIDTLHTCIMHQHCSNNIATFTLIKTNDNSIK